MPTQTWNFTHPATARGAATNSGSWTGFTAPVAGVYDFEAVGGPGGDCGPSVLGGYSAKITGKITLAQGEYLYILVGKKGWSNPTWSDWGGGGGGATWIYASNGSTLLVCAAGGGGTGDSCCNTSKYYGGEARSDNYAWTYSSAPMRAAYYSPYNTYTGDAKAGCCTNEIRPGRTTETGNMREACGGGGRPYCAGGGGAGHIGGNCGYYGGSSYSAVYSYGDGGWSAFNTSRVTATVAYGHNTLEHGHLTISYTPPPPVDQGDGTFKDSAGNIFLPVYKDKTAKVLSRYIKIRNGIEHIPAFLGNGYIDPENGQQPTEHWLHEPDTASRNENLWGGWHGGPGFAMPDFSKPRDIVWFGRHDYDR